MKNIKSILILSTIIVSLSIIIFGITATPYFLSFSNSSFSENTYDWGAFGGFISGLTSIINLSVFIILTIYISKLSNANSEKQIRTQKKTIISEFRQTEINNLSTELDKAFKFNGYERKGELINLYNQVYIYLTNFQNQKKYLFPILESNIVVKDRIRILLEKYDQISIIVDEIHGKDNISKDIESEIETKIQFAILMKNELIEALQLFVLEDLDN